MSAPALDPTLATSLCVKCHGVVVEHGRSHIHLNGQYTCSTGFPDTALPYDGDICEWHQASFDKGYDEGYDEGRDQVADEISDAEHSAAHEARENAINVIETAMTRAIEGLR